MKRARYETRLLVPAKWTGTATGVSGAVLIALNLDVVVYGFGLFLLSSLLWVWVGWMHREASLVVLQSAFTLINVFGFYRWVQL